MKIAFLIQAHELPQLTYRLIQRLKGYGDIYLHIDSKVDITQFKNIIGEDVFYTQRYDVRWGASQQPAVTVNMLEYATSQKYYDYFSVHSGVDYPIRPIDEFLAFLESYKGEEFIDCEPMPEKNYQRFEKYHLRYFYKTRNGKCFSDKLIHFFESTVKKIFPKKKHYQSLPPYFGSNWFTVTHAFAKATASYWNQNKSVRRYAFFMLCPDEWFFQTMGMTMELLTKNNNNYGNLRYVDWRCPPPCPKVLKEEDFESLIASNKFFARKMNVESMELMNMLDAYANVKTS